MALIRLVNHHPKNPNHIDKMIVIKGLPEDWVFLKKVDGSIELKAPWEPDVDANIPVVLRHFCEPMDLTFRFSPIHNEGEWVIEKRKVLGLRLDYSRQPAKELWERIEKYVDDTLPRHMKVPTPQLVAKNQRDPFDLGPETMPVVDLLSRGEALPPPIVVRPVQEKPDRPKEPVQDNYCDICNKTFLNKQARTMHNTKKHRVVVGV